GRGGPARARAAHRRAHRRRLPGLTACGCSVRGMQGTVATYDAATRSGMLLLDDGTELAFPARAFDASGLRLLRLGQRVRIDTDATGEVVRVTLPTMA
ncbi:cold-shock protein, partial [Micromonospora phytophila]|uniref:cold-shock protein n=1 Tax=Micromonospora phytophila TaxID=709888 RepID=UPI003FD72960